MKFITLALAAALAAPALADDLPTSEVGFLLTVEGEPVTEAPEENPCTADGYDLIWIKVHISPDQERDASFRIEDECDTFQEIGGVPRSDTDAGDQDFFFCLNPDRKYRFYYDDADGGPDVDPGDFYKLQRGLEGDVIKMQTLEDDANIDFTFGSCNGRGEGDPHFKTLAGTNFDFHGQCDLVLMNAPGFMNGLGLDVHARTQARYEYSFIETAAVKIGNDILEVSSYGATQFNGVADAKFPLTMGGQVAVELVKEDNKNHVFELDLGNNEKITIKAFKDLVAVTVPGNDAVLGENHSGLFGQAEADMVDRAGNAMTDPVEFGMEWQVRDTDAKLFQNMDHFPQWPEKCVMPKITLEERRRLGEVKISEEQAKRACEVAGARNMEACIYDVLATGELDMAGAGAF